MINLRPAAALLALANADPLKLTAAEQDRRERLLLGEENDKTASEMVAGLALEAEFHRAVLEKVQDGADNNNGSVSGNNESLMARKQRRKERIDQIFARHPHLADMVDRIQKRNQNRDRRNLLTLKQQQNNQHIHNHEKRQRRSVQDVDSKSQQLEVEGSELDFNAGLDMGVIRKPNAEAGFTKSNSGGNSVAKATFPFDRQLQGMQQGICPSGCDQTVCDCYSYEIDDPDICIPAQIEACRDGSYVTSCYSGTYDIVNAYNEVYCAREVCYFDNDLMDEVLMSDYGACDISGERCQECACETYGEVCEVFKRLGCPRNEDYADYYFCYDVDYLCAVKECCDTYSPGECVYGDETYEPGLFPTYNPGYYTLMPYGGEPAPAPRPRPFDAPRPESRPDSGDRRPSGGVSVSFGDSVATVNESPSTSGGAVVVVASIPYALMGMAAAGCAVLSVVVNVVF